MLELIKASKGELKNVGERKSQSRNSEFKILRLYQSWGIFEVMIRVTTRT